MATDDITPRIRFKHYGFKLPSPRVLAISAAALAVITLCCIWWSARENVAPRPKTIFAPMPRLDAAIAAAQERLKADPQDISALVELGLLHFDKGPEAYLDSLNELEEARELGALDARIFYCLGVMYQEEGLYPFALEEYKRFLRHYPEDKEVRLLAAKLQYKQGKFADAVLEYETLRQHFPGDALIEENLGLSLWSAKFSDRAADSFRRLKMMGPDQSKRAEFYLGQMATEKKRYAEAIEHFEAALGSDGSPAVGIAREAVYAALAGALQRTSKLQEAKDAWQKVLDAKPTDLKLAAQAQSALRDINRRLPIHRKAATHTK